MARIPAPPPRPASGRPASGRPAWLDRLLDALAPRPHLIPIRVPARAPKRPLK